MKLVSGGEVQKEKLVEDILIKNYERYYRLAYSYVHNEADACDIVQNGAYKAIRGSRGLRQGQFAETWVYRIMLNEVFRFCDRKENTFVPIDEISAEQGKEDEYQDLDLQRALNSLCDKDRAVVILRFFEDRKLDDIAEILGENINTVKSRLYRSVKRLRLTLEDEV